MTPPPVRFSQLRWLHSAACVLAMLGSFLLIALGLLGYGSSGTVWMVAAGGLALFLSIALMGLMPLLVKMESTIARQQDAVRDVHDRIQGFAARLEAIAENTRISDAAKSLAHREQEVEAFRIAIREEVRHQKWDAALKLIDAIEHRFGYTQEADTFRTEVEQARRETIANKLNDAIKVVESHFTVHDWDKAQAEIDRLLRALPENARVISLIERAKVLRQHHKEQLLHAWEDAVRRSDVDTAIDILKELDQYLAPAEAATLQASARTVFKEKLLQLGVKFRFAVTEKRWQDALTAGLELVDEFPNARMAAEVRDVLDTLRERARQQQLVEHHHAAVAPAPRTPHRTVPHSAAGSD